MTIIPVLIDKQDTFEIVRDQIASILAEETASQQALAIAAGEDPDLWKLRIFINRSNPWEQFLNAPADLSPLVSVWYDNSVFPESKGNAISHQHSDSAYFIDVYGYAESAASGSGHLPGDREAAYVSQRGVRLVRNILMSSNHLYLDLRGVVGMHWTQLIETFRPEINGQAIENIVGSRLTLRVGFRETAPHGDESNLLEYVSVDVKRAEDGEVVAEADYDYTS